MRHRRAHREVSGVEAARPPKTQQPYCSDSAGGAVPSAAGAGNCMATRVYGSQRSAGGFCVSYDATNVMRESFTAINS